MSTSTRLPGSQTPLDATNLDADGAIAEVKQRLQLFHNQHHLNEQHCRIYRQTECVLSLGLFLVKQVFEQVIKNQIGSHNITTIPMFRIDWIHLYLLNRF